ncbi:MAG TPA: thioesterase family protein [Candidatus Dormibacteraeota bacterium]|jgi:acyl-CoA thioester hydrolase|nr:thioesterase family protein [Candidatus Dormibacteraeota bacterium]
MAKQLEIPAALEPGSYPWIVDYQVFLADADNMGIVHHSRYLPYLEEARASWVCRLAGTESLADMPWGSPVIELAIKYHTPARGGDVIRVHVRASAISAAKIELAYLVTRPKDGVTVLTAATINAFIDAQTGRPTRVPRWLAEGLQPAA